MHTFFALYALLHSVCTVLASHLQPCCPPVLSPPDTIPSGVLCSFPPTPQTVSPAIGLCPVTRRAISHLLSKNGTGNAVAIVIGGAAESLSCSPGVTTLILKNRKGFVRMALQHG